jgi:ComF family protein
LHSGAVRGRVHQFKFEGRMEWLPALVQLLETAYVNWGTESPDVVVPVPLHPKRLRERGFNQSGLLAKEFSRRHGLPVSFDLLIRKKWTEPQTRLNRKERLENVKGAFGLRDASAVPGRRILLIDDVFTTGTTLSECARTLKKGGASEVYVLTVTRALPD